MRQCGQCIYGRGGYVDGCFFLRKKIYNITPIRFTYSGACDIGYLSFVKVVTSVNSKLLLSNSCNSCSCAIFLTVFFFKKRSKFHCRPISNPIAIRKNMNESRIGRMAQAVKTCPAVKTWANANVKTCQARENISTRLSIQNL